MSTNSTLITSVGLTSLAVTAAEVERDDQKRKSQKQAEGAYDDYDTAISEEGKTAGSAEASAPKSVGKHASLKNARSQLIKVLDQSGEKPKQSDSEGTILGSYTESILEKMDQKIAESKDVKESERLKEFQNKISGSLSNYQAAHANALSDDALQGSEPDVSANQSQEVMTSSTTAMHPEEESLWTDLQSIGSRYNVATSQSEAGTDAETSRTAIIAQMKKSALGIKNDQSTLEAQRKDLEEKVKVAAPEEKQALETALKSTQEQLQLVSQKTQQLHQDFSKVNDVSENILRFQVSQQLGGVSDEKILLKKKASVEISPRKSSSEKEKPSDNVTIAPKLATESVAVASGSEASVAPVTQGVEQKNGSRESRLSSASVEKGASEYVAPSNIVRTNSLSDFITSQSISSSTDTVVTQVRKMKKNLDDLIRQVHSGNTEAIQFAMFTLTGMTSKMTTQVAAQALTISSNKLQELQVESDKVSSADGTSANYSAVLASAQVNMMRLQTDSTSAMKLVDSAMTLQQEMTTSTGDLIKRMEQTVQAAQRG